MPRPVHFEIPAENPERAMKFYQAVFGWSFQKWDGPMPYWLITTGPASEPGITGHQRRIDSAARPGATLREHRGGGEHR